MTGRVKKAVVLTGGTGRMTPLIGGESKCLVEVAGKKVVDYVLEAVSRIGVREVIVVVDSSKMEEHLVENWSLKAPVRIVKQKEEGIEGAIVSAEDYLESNETFLLAYGDVVMPVEAYETLLRSYLENLTPLHALIAPTSTPQTYGVVVVEGEKVVEVVEKPRDTYYSTLALVGAFIVKGELVEQFKSKGLIETFNSASSSGNFTATVWNGWWVDLDLPWDIISAVKAVLRGVRESRISGKAKISPSAIIEGPVIIDEGAEVDHQAIIKGPVYIGKRAFIGAGAFVREYTSIEKEAVVGFRSEVKRSSLQPRATVSGFSYIADSIVGEESSISVGVKTLNILPPHVEVDRILEEVAKGRKLRKLGAVFGKKCRVGAGTILYPGAIVDAESWVEPLSKVESRLGFSGSPQI